MTEILFKELSFAIFGAAIEVYNTLGNASWRLFTRKLWDMSSSCEAFLLRNKYGYQ